MKALPLALCVLLAASLGACEDSAVPTQAPPDDDPPPGEPPVGEPVRFVGWFELRPRAVAAGGGETVTLTVRTDRPVDSVRLTLPGGDRVGLTDAGQGHHRADLASELLLERYQAGEMKAHAGGFEALIDGAWRPGGHFQVNVLEAPSPSASSLRTRRPPTGSSTSGRTLPCSARRTSRFVP